MSQGITFDPVSFLREFGLSIVIIVYVGWIVIAACRSILPPIGAAIGRWFDAQTKQIEETTSVVRKIPEIIAQCFKEMREASIASEGRIRDDFRVSVENLKEIIENDRLIRIEKNTERIVRKTISPTDPDTDPLPSRPTPQKK